MWFSSVPPKINTSDLLHNPGNCLDLTKQEQNVVMVGEDVCVRAGPNARLTLTCQVFQGVPEPALQWDSPHSARRISRISADGNSLDLLLPSDASYSSKLLIEGNYTCVARNTAGITTATTYVTLFGGMWVVTLIHH